MLLFLLALLDCNNFDNFSYYDADLKGCISQKADAESCDRN